MGNIHERRPEVNILLVMPGRGRTMFPDSEQTVTSGGKNFPRSLLPSSSLLEVAGMTPRGYNVRIHDELAQGPVGNVMLEWADIVGVSGLSTSHWGALEVAERARELEKKVVAGGMHVTGLVEESQHNATKLLEYYDAIVVGHLTPMLWTEVIVDLSSDDSKGVYRASDPWQFVIPTHSLVVAKHHYLPDTIRTSAGCPHNCDFCTVDLVCPRFVDKPLEILEAELAHYRRKRRFLGLEIPLVLHDDSFGARYGHTVNVVLPALKRCGRRWFAEITIQNLGGNGSRREPLIGPMKDAGCVAVYIGVEDPFTADLSDKSLSRDEIEKVIKASHRAGLVVMGSIILDVTGKETADSIRRVVKWCIDVGLDLVQYSLVAALPGSETRSIAMANNQIICNNPALCTGGYPTLHHPILSPEERIELLHYAYDRTYSAEGILRRTVGHKHPFLNLHANRVVYRMTSGWWEKFGYEYWFVNRERGCWD